MEDLKLHTIYDERRSEKYDALINELFVQGIDYQLWMPVEAKTVVESINLSHKAIVKYAKRHGMDRIFIAEDDCFFPAKDGWQHFLRNMPSDFDLYSAATYTDDLHNKNILCGFHLYCISEKFYDRFLSIPDNVHIDTACNSLNGNFVVCRPFAALQRKGFSANNQMIADYNLLLKPEDIYYGKL
jgi:hypothetical protein